MTKQRCCKNCKLPRRAGATKRRLTDHRPGQEAGQEDVDDHTPEEILEASDQLMGVIYKVTGYRFAHVSFRGRTE